MKDDAIRSWLEAAAKALKPLLDSMEAMMKPSYLLNTRSHILHKNPPAEVCNTDQIPAKYKKQLYTVVTETVSKRCKHCFPVAKHK